MTFDPENLTDYDLERLKDMDIWEAMEEFLPGELNDGHTTEDRIMLGRIWESAQQAKHGWTAHSVFDDNTTQPEEAMPYGINHHTHGFEDNLGHPDMQMVLNIPPEAVGGVFHEIADKIKDGARFDDTSVDYEKILQGGYKIRTRWVTEGGRRVLRIILPDPDGNLDEDALHENYNKQYEGTSLTRDQDGPMILLIEQGAHEHRP